MPDNEEAMFVSDFLLLSKLLSLRLGYEHKSEEKDSQELIQLADAPSKDRLPLLQSLPLEL